MTVGFQHKESIVFTRYRPTKVGVGEGRDENEQPMIKAFQNPSWRRKIAPTSGGGKKEWKWRFKSHC
jgi:hypothetical protein